MGFCRRSIEDFDILLIPGGRGVGYNLCNYFIKGENYEVEPSVKKVINELKDEGQELNISNDLQKYIMINDFSLFESERSLRHKVTKIVKTKDTKETFEKGIDFEIE